MRGVAQFHEGEWRGGEFNPRAGGTPPGTLEKMEQTAVELGATVMSLNAIFLNNGEPTIRWYAPGPVFR